MRLLKISRTLIVRHFLSLLSVGCALFERLPTATKSHALRADAATRHLISTHVKIFESRICVMLNA